MSTDDEVDASPLDRPGATLVCNTSLGSSGREACTRALEPGDDASVLWVSYTDSPAECFARLPSVPAERKSVIDIGGTRSATGAEETTMTDEGRVAVADPNDLTGIGIAVAEQLRDNAGVRVCFDSLTALLQYVDADRAYTFLNSLLGHLWNADAHAHFHFNPEAHDGETVAAVTSLFDARVDIDDGSVRVPGQTDW